MALGNSNVAVVFVPTLQLVVVVDEASDIREVVDVGEKVVKSKEDVDRVVEGEDDFVTAVTIERSVL